MGVICRVDVMPSDIAISKVYVNMEKVFFVYLEQFVINKRL